MRILPISNTQYKKSYTDNNIKNKNTVFKSASKKSLELVQKIPLEERLASMFEKIDSGDLILVGKKINVAKIKMLESIDSFQNIIKRVFYIPEDKYKGYLGFFKDNDGNREVINLNDFDIRLCDAESIKPERLTPHDSYYIFDGDLVAVPGNDDAIQILPKSKVDLTGYRKNFCKALDFRTWEKSEVERINRKILAQLSREVQERSTKVTFKDVGGQDELIKELKRSILYPLKYPEAYQNYELNKGIILYGPPGTGKTHIAKALANEADAHFISLNGLEMEGKYVGESEENWRSLFDEAKQKQPTIMFIDEIDSIGKSRGSVDVHGDKVLNQLLTLISDLDSSTDNIFVIGATNNFKALDKALIRSARLSKHIEVKLPDLNGVRQIFEIHTSKKPVDTKINKEALVKRLYDLKATGGDIKYISNEAYINGYERAGIHKKMEEDVLSMKDLRDFKIIQEDFDKAIKAFIENRHGKERQPVGFNK